MMDEREVSIFRVRFSDDCQTLHTYYPTLTHLQQPLTSSSSSSRGNGSWSQQQQQQDNNKKASASGNSPSSTALEATQLLRYVAPTYDFGYEKMVEDFVVAQRHGALVSDYVMTLIGEEKGHRVEVSREENSIREQVFQAFTYYKANILQEEISYYVNGLQLEEAQARSIISQEHTRFVTWVLDCLPQWEAAATARTAQRIEEETRQKEIAELQRLQEEEIRRQAEETKKREEALRQEALYRMEKEREEAALKKQREIQRLAELEREAIEKAARKRAEQQAMIEKAARDREEQLRQLREQEEALKREEERRQAEEQRKKEEAYLQLKEQEAAIQRRLEEKKAAEQRKKEEEYLRLIQEEETLQWQLEQKAAAKQRQKEEAYQRLVEQENAVKAKMQAQADAQKAKEEEDRKQKDLLKEHIAAEEQILKEKIADAERKKDTMRSVQRAQELEALRLRENALMEKLRRKEREEEARLQQERRYKEERENYQRMLSEVQKEQEEMMKAARLAKQEEELQLALHLAKKKELSIREKAFASSVSRHAAGQPTHAPQQQQYSYSQVASPQQSERRYVDPNQALSWGGAHVQQQRQLPEPAQQAGAYSGMHPSWQQQQQQQQPGNFQPNHPAYYGTCGVTPNHSQLPTAAHHQYQQPQPQPQPQSYPYPGASGGGGGPSMNAAYYNNTSSFHHGPHANAQPPHVHANPQQQMYPGGYPGAHPGTVQGTAPWYPNPTSTPDAGASLNEPPPPPYT